MESAGYRGPSPFARAVNGSRLCLLPLGHVRRHARYTAVELSRSPRSLWESHAGVGARVGSAGPFRGCSGEGRFQQSLALPSAVRPGKAAGQRRVRPSWRVRTRPFRPSDPCSKIVLLPAPPAGFEPAHTAPEAAAPFCRICVCGLRNPVLVLRRAARQFRACSGSCSLASGAATSVT